MPLFPFQLFGPVLPPFEVSFQNDHTYAEGAVDEAKGEVIGDEIWDKYSKRPVYSKFFESMDPIPSWRRISE